jgi:hypothetical protein
MGCSTSTIQQANTFGAAYSFSASTHQATKNSTQTRVDVSKLTDVVNSFLLTCKMDGQQIILEIETPKTKISIKQTKPFEFETILIHVWQLKYPGRNT